MTNLSRGSGRRCRAALSALAFGLAALVGLGAAVGAEPSEPPVVVELFTSQGCSSCPPAEAFLSRLAQQEGIIALALHVDYWDYLGWKDRFADRRFTLRQREYAQAWGARSVYTPQIVIDGRWGLVANRPMDVAMKIREAMDRDKPVRLAATRQAGDRVILDITPRDEATGDIEPGPADLYVARYLPEVEVEITRGENAGKRLRHTNVVTDLERVGTWKGRGPARFEVVLDGRLPAVAFLQKRGPGPILAAARIPAP